MKNPFSLLLKSRKFWLMVLDAVVSLLLLFFADFPNIEAVIGIMQPVFVAVIVGIAVEDAALKVNK